MNAHRNVRGRSMRSKSWPRVGLLGLLACSPASCGGDNHEEPPLKAPTLLELDLTSAFSERDQSFLTDERPSFAKALDRVQAMGSESLARGLFVRLGELGGHWSDVDEWAQVFDGLRAKKKPVHCAFETLDNAGYALAAHCDSLSMTPAGTLDLVGLAAQVLHGRELLESIGVRAELLQMGRYKGAAEPFTRDSMSEPLRESLNGLLDDLDARFRVHLKTRAKLKDADLETLIGGGPFHADSAHAAQLVDMVSYDDEARERAKTAVSATDVRQVFPRHPDEALSLRDLLKLLSDDEEGKKLKSQDRIVYASLVGEIVDGDRMGAERAASEPFVMAMRRFADDKHVKALVLRIESPGGSALASDRMWHAVRRVAGRKPVIVTMGDMAASGGYYVACAGSYVLANEGSIVGSIGVVGGKIVFSGLAERVGVHADTIKRGEHAGWLSPLSPFSDAERGQLEKLLQDTYDRFLQRVAMGRKRDVALIAQAAEGRVMGGARAKRLGLVDEIGGISRAMQLARERGNLARDAPIETWPNAVDPLSALTGALGGAQAHTPDARLLGDLSRLSEATQVREGASWLTHLTPGRPAAVLPAHLSVR